MHTTFAVRSTLTLATALALGVAARAADDGPVERTDLLTFAQGAVPVSVGGDGARLGATFEHAVKIIDGNPAGFVVLNKGNDGTVTEFVYELPAATTFDYLAVPNILETPSPGATFTRSVEIHGSSRSAREGYELLASATLSTHGRKGDVTELTLAKMLPVRWVKVRLRGGIDLPHGEGALEFSEIVGQGTQDPAAFSDRFSGTWKQGANLMSLSQQGAVVSGCYDRSGDLSGTVTGNVLRATGVDRSDRTRSAFILSVTPEGSLRGVRSSNGAPFRLYTAPPAPQGTETSCAVPAVALGCGSVIHGITFDFDSAVIRPDAEPVLVALHQGLRNDQKASISIEGHTSSEGSTEYNQSLSTRRAQAVVAELGRRGIAARRLSAVGVGELRPIANNSDENGRAMNRRVEVVCR